jgi:uncharacterized OsmC-like protein
MTSPTGNIREYEIRARSTDVFGRVLCSARDHHFVIDGPVQNGCPGEEITPSEAFLSAVAACSVELIHVIARDGAIPLRHVRVRISGTIDRDHQPRPGVTLFNTVRLEFELAGVSTQQATTLVDGFKGRCPLFGTVSVATPDVVVTVHATP